MKVPSYFSLRIARKVQSFISANVVKCDSISLPSLRLIGGVDVAYTKSRAIGAWVVLDFKTFSVIDYAVSDVRVKFPYVPTLLSFREVSPAVSAYMRLKVKPEISLVDGQGQLHPYRAGFASHLGIVLNIATIGVAKKLLCGVIGEWKDSWAPVVEKGEVIGAALKSKRKLIYVSIGNKVSLETAIRIVKLCTRDHWLPEPIRAAHSLATRTARRIAKSRKQMKNSLYNFRCAG